MHATLILLRCVALCTGLSGGDAHQHSDTSVTELCSRAAGYHYAVHLVRYNDASRYIMHSTKQSCFKALITSYYHMII
jgi:hypothetical protein